MSLRIFISGAEIVLEEIRSILRDKDILIVYPWDPDGLLASVILTDAVANEDKRIGYFAHQEFRPGISLIEKIASLSRRYDSVVVLGSGWQGPEIDMLASNIYGELVILDNSYMYLRPQKSNVLYFNPSPKGDPRGNWPTLSFLVNVVLNGEYYIEVAASIVSLLDKAAIGSRIYQNMMVKAGLNHINDFELPKSCANRLWGITVSQPPEPYQEIPRSLIESGYNVCGALLNDVLLASYEVIGADLIERVSEKDIELSGENIVVNAGEELNYSTLLLSSRIIAKDNSRLAIVLSRWRNGCSFCSWSLSKKPLAGKVGEIRRIGGGARGVYQGVINYLCGRIRNRTVLERIIQE